MAAPTSKFVVLLLLLTSTFFTSCSDKPDSSSLSPLDSTSDTAAWLSQAHALSIDARQPAAQIHALNSLGGYYKKQQIFDSALQYYTHARNLSVKENLAHEQVQALVGMSRCYYETQQEDSLLACVQKAYEISSASSDVKDKALAAQELGIYYVEERDSANALKYLNEELSYDTLLHDSAAMSDCYSNMGTVYSQKGDYPRSIQSYQQAIAIAERLKNDTDIATYSSNLGIVFKEQADYNLALEQLLKAELFFERIHAAQSLASCYNSIGNTYTELMQPQKAIEYHVRAWHLRDSIDYKRGVAGSLTNIAHANLVLGRYDTALNYLDRSLLIKYQLGDSQLIASSIDLKGEVYYLKKEFARAESLYKEALDLKAIAGDPKSIGITQKKLGLLYHAWGKDNEALNELRAARVHFEKTGAKKELEENYKIMTDVFVTQGNADSALYYTDLRMAVKDSIMSEQKQKALTEMEVKYETEKKDKDILVLHAEAKAKEALLDRQHIMIYSLVGGTVLLVVLILLLFSAARSRRIALDQSKVIIEQKQTIIEQKQAMMSELHHRIKNNLQVLSNLLELQQSRIQDPVMTELMKAIDQRLTAMLLIHQGLYGDDIGSQVDMRDYIDALIRNLCQSYGYSASDLNITKDVAPLRVEADKALSLGFVCNEIISNWFKHALRKKDNATLKIELNHNVLRLSDNGPGIPPEKMADYSGSFGLRLIQLFSQELNARLQLHSDPQGTSITLELP